MVNIIRRQLGMSRSLYPPSTSVTGGWESPPEERMSQPAGGPRGPNAVLRRTVSLGKVVRATGQFAICRRLRERYDRGLGVPNMPLSRSYAAHPGAPAGNAPAFRTVKVVTWLILPVVICLSQRLSHACPSISNLYGETANGSLNQLSFI